MRCEVIFHLACQEPLGMESRAIEDAQISASSFDANHSPDQARLNSARAWVAKFTNGNQYLRVSLGYEYNRITQIATQGRADSDQWVKSYRIKYYSNGKGHHYNESGETASKVSN